MDIIIPNIKKYSDGEIDRAFMKEIKTGFNLERQTEQKRVAQAVKEAKELRGKTHPVLGKPVATMPAREFFRLTQKYGQETVHSKEFLKYYNKKFPELSPKQNIMQDRTYSDLLFLIQSLVGGGNLTTEEQGSIDSFINRRAHEAFQTSQTWPRFLVGSEQRDIISLNISGLGAGTNTNPIINGNYILIGQDSGASGAVAGSNVYYNIATGIKSSTNIGNATSIYKRASTNRWEIEVSSDMDINADGSIDYNAGGGQTVMFEADTDKKDNPSEVVTWTLTATLVSGTPLVVDKQLIPYAQTGKNSIGEFLKVYRKKAFLNDSSLEYDFFVDFNGANILNVANTNDNSAFVTYKKELPQYTITSINIPGEWFFFIAHGSYADFLRMEGKVEQSMAEEDVAQKYLAQELEKVDNMSNNNVFRRFSTHGTRQSR